jgi:hypothetical protein
MTCQCGKIYPFKKEFEGKLVKCPECRSEFRVVAKMTAQQNIPSRVSDGFWDRDKFLLRQKIWTVSEKYYVRDEHKNPILFIERPAKVWRNFFAFFSAILVGGTNFIIFGWFMLSHSEGSTVLLVLSLLWAFGGSAFLVFVLLNSLVPKRHIVFYKDEKKDRRPTIIDIMPFRLYDIGR